MVIAAKTKKNNNINKLVEPLFEPADFFMVRSTTLPVNRFKELSKNELISILREYAEFDFIKEAIIIASPRLYNALPNIHNDICNKKTQKVASSFLRYLLRMVSRPTPFGAFSGISSGTFEEKTSLFKKEEDKSLKKRARPDMEWLFAVVNILEGQFDITKHMKVKTNHASYQLGNRMYLPFTTDCGQLKQKNTTRTEKISIRYTSLVKQVLDIASTPIRLEEIIETFMNQYQEVPKEKVQNFVWELFQQEFLISELRPPLTIDSPLDYLIDKLSEIDDVEHTKKMSQKLITIKKLISNYNSTPLGKGIDLYKNAINNMKEIYDIENPLQVDTHIDLGEAILNKSIGNDIAEAAKVLWKLSSKQIGFNHLKDYHLKFLEKYGTAREVPVLELLSEEIGLGEPEFYSKQQIKVEEESNFDKIKHDMDLSYLLIDAIHNQKREIHITDELVEKIAVGHERKFAPDSLEVYIEIFAESQEEIDNGNYNLCIGPNPGSDSAGSSFGRFTDILESDTYQQIKTLHENQNDTFDHDITFVEGTYLPPAGRSANVALGKSIRDYELAIGTNPRQDVNSLNLSDIHVGATLEGLYLKSKSLNKQIKVMANNMLNFNGAPSVYRFLREVSLNDIAHWGPFVWGKMDLSPYYPRIRYKNTILAPAIWKLNSRIIGLEEKPKDDEIFIDAIDKWREKWSVPKHVYMTYGDNRILIDLDNVYHLKELKNELYRHSRLQLREVVAPLEQSVVKNSNEKFVSEIVVPLKKKSHIEKRSNIAFSHKQKVNENDIKRLPGDEWLYIKLYVPSSREDEFLKNKLSVFANSILEENLAYSWFFIRYHDTDPHIRLRFKGDPETLISMLLPKVKNWAAQCMEECLLKKISIDTYEKETERYGGPLLIDYAENWFFGDSMVVTQLLKLNSQGHLPNLPIHVIGSLNIIYIMETLGMDFKWQLNWIASITDKYRFSDEFRPFRKMLLKLSDPNNKWVEMRKYSDDKGINLYDTLSIQEPFLINYGEKISKLKKSGDLWNKEEMIIGSLIHMHCNRLMGINRESEKKALAFARHLLFSQRFWRDKGEI